MDASLKGLYQEIEMFEPQCDQEQVDKLLMLERLGCDADVLSRTSLAHFTCSAWTVSETGAQALLVYHNVYNSWSWIGGHADGNPDLAAVSLRELAEETGVSAARIVGAQSASRLLSLEALPVAGHMKRGKYVSSHTHLNLTYLAVADPAAPVREKPDENSAVRWVALNQVEELSSEPWMCTFVYRKLIARTKALLG